MHRQTPEGISKVLLEGTIAVRPFGIAGDLTAIPLIIRNAAYTFTPIDGVCELVKDDGPVKTFRVKLPLNTTEPREVLRYEGPMAAESAPLTARPLSLREGNVTTVNMAVNASARLQAEITAMNLMIAPPLLNEKGDGTKPHGINPKGAFLKQSQRIRWKDQIVDIGAEVVYAGQLIETVEPERKDKRDWEYCQASADGQFLGILSGISPAIGEDVDEHLHCTYQKHEFLASSHFKYQFKP